MRIKLEVWWMDEAGMWSDGPHLLEETHSAPNDNSNIQLHLSSMKCVSRKQIFEASVTSIMWPSGCFSEILNSSLGATSSSTEMRGSVSELGGKYGR